MDCRSGNYKRGTTTSMTILQGTTHTHAVIELLETADSSAHPLKTFLLKDV